MTNYYQRTQQYLKEFFKISDESLDKILLKLPPKKIHEYIGHKTEIYRSLVDNPDENVNKNKLNNDYWNNSYNIIRGENWPNCTTINDFYTLPENIQNECREVHKFSPDIWFNTSLSFDTWVEYGDWSYEMTSILHTNLVLIENLEFIENKSIVDFSTHTGFLSSVCLFNNAKDVLFTDIRQEVLNLAQERMHLMGYGAEKYKSVLADIHNYSSNTKLCQNADTVIIAGVLYHVHDHYAILESVTKANPETIIIETVHKEDIANLDDPLVYWATEGTLNNIANGWYDNLSSVMVGLPNLKWFELTMQFMGYKETKKTLYQTWNPIDDIDNTPEPTQLRSVQVFNKL